MREKWPELAKKWRGALGKYQYALLVLGLGAVLLLLPSGRDSPQTGPEEESAAQGFDLAAFEEKMEKALSRVDGAGETKVVLSLDSGSRQVLAQDQERDEGGSSSAVVTLGRGSGAQEVAVIQTVAPKFRGALVVCPGGNDPKTRLALLQAVSALTGLGADHISICGGEP